MMLCGIYDFLLMGEGYCHLTLYSCIGSMILEGEKGILFCIAVKNEDCLDCCK